MYNVTFVLRDMRFLTAVLLILSRLGYYAVTTGCLALQKKAVRYFDTLENERRHGVTSPRLECSTFIYLFIYFLRITTGICPSAYTLNNYSVVRISKPLSYGVPVRERYGSTLLPATREQHDQNCTQSH